MADLFDRYRECNEIVGSMPPGASQDHAHNITLQLLHIEQARKVAHDAYNRYRDQMNDWENNLVRDIRRMAEEAGARMDADAPERGKDGRDG